VVKNKIALVTGASSGIGREIAIQLAKQGIDVCINYLHSEKAADNVKKEIEQFGVNVKIFRADVSKEDEVKNMFSFLYKKFGGLDILINNAGTHIANLIENYEYKDWKRIIGVNLIGKFLCTKHSIPLLKKSQSGKIINIASRLGLKPRETQSAYCCSNAATIMLTKASALELSKYNIKVNTISPGLTKTNLTNLFFTEEEFQEYAKKSPSNRLGTPLDIANSVLFLISEKADLINGENINVNGGILLK
jgi:3-oxoacyl-[acyl-carrier protein] reductase